MKIRSFEELNSSLSTDLAWRKKELTTIYLQIQKEKRDHIKEAFIRMAVPMLYAHWEGYIKNSSSWYLQLVSRQKEKYSALTSNFLAIACRGTIKEVSMSNQTYLHSQLVDFLLYNTEEKAVIPYKGIIETESNLSSRVLKNILFTIGISNDGFWAKKSLEIDGKLLNNRNKIVHGERNNVPLESYLDLHILVIDSLSHIKSTIENAAATKHYLRS